MNATPISFTASLFKYPGKGGWHFIEVPVNRVPTEFGDWGRAPVLATIDGTPTETSIWRGKDGRILLSIPRRLRSTKIAGDSITATLAARAPESARSRSTEKPPFREAFRKPLSYAGVTAQR